MSFEQVLDSDGALVSVDFTGGLQSNPNWCGQGKHTFTLQDYGDRQLGGRPADYRRWLYVCGDGTQWPIEQYVADNKPGYILFSDHSDSAVHNAMTAIAAASVLPPITAPLRLSDFGILRSVSQDKFGYRVTLDRVVQGDPGTGLINNSTATYSYVIPNAALAATSPSRLPHVGQFVTIYTDGTTVKQFTDGTTVRQ